MAMYLLYCGLLALWLLLPWPALRIGGWNRVWLLVVAAAGLVATLHEVRMYLWTPSAIRFDILLIAVVLVCLYGSAVVILFRADWWKTATTLVSILVLVGGGMLYKWTEVSRESVRVREAFDTSNTLLFEAKFQNPERYGSYFGPFAPADAAHPVGHWRASGDVHYTRLVINAAGDLWLFYPCSRAECAFASTGRRGQSLRPHPEGGWQATGSHRAIAPLEIRVRRDGPDNLSVEARGRTAPFETAPPPIIDATAAPESLDYLGAFAAVTCKRQHAAVRQFWLWRDGERLYAIAIVSTLVAGRRNDFVQPIPLGEGTPADGGWRFTWERNSRTWKALLSLAGPDPVLNLERDGVEPERVVLDRPAVFRDEVVHLAPRTGAADWTHWFENVFVGHFSSGEVPAC